MNHNPLHRIHHQAHTHGTEEHRRVKVSILLHCGYFSSVFQVTIWVERHTGQVVCTSTPLYHSDRAREASETFLEHISFSMQETSAISTMVGELSCMAVDLLFLSLVLSPLCSIGTLFVAFMFIIYL